ncbi:hypothetical protein CPB86DRAFT_877750 [Serendipita vermifera]|nr:hypothetical protein CPB86DRAFT_877750 [Serendipita vermifera]
MVKTTKNAAVESTAAARSATERANQTNAARDIQDAISEWGKVIQTVIDGDPSAEHARSLESYADLFLLIWISVHQIADIRAAVSNLERALEKLLSSSTRACYDLLIRLARVSETLYYKSKEDEDALSHAIRYWEEAYELSSALRFKKKAVNEILPNLADACFTGFRKELCGLGSLNQAMHYYQLALAQPRSDLQTQLRLGLGKVYLELMYHVDAAGNAQSAIDCFEIVLKKSNDKEELLEASNGKSEGWWWKIVTTEEDHKLFKEDEEDPFRVWATNVATTYQNDTTAAGC